MQAYPNFMKGTCSALANYRPISLTYLHMYGVNYWNTIIHMYVHLFSVQFEVKILSNKQHGFCIEMM